MIRRGFWLTAGAVTGIYGYRRVTAVTRRLSASLNPAGPGVSPAGPGASLTQRARLAHRGRRGAIRMARQTFRFTRDVREGMEIYRLAHSGPADPTLSADSPTDHEPEDGH